VARQPGAFGAHPGFEIDDDRLGFLLPHRQPVAGRLAIDLALYGEDRVDAPNRFDRQRRLAQVGLLKEVAPAVAPACRLGNRAEFAFAVVEIAKPGIDIGLQDAGLAGEMPQGMLAGPVARVKEHRRRRGRPGKRPVIAHLSPQSAGYRFARTGTVVSSPCTRSASNTWQRISSVSGLSTAAAAPT